MGMKQPNSQNEFANKALQVTAHKSPNMNAAAANRLSGLLHVERPIHNAKGKSIDRAATISESEARNSR